MGELVLFGGINSLWCCTIRRRRSPTLPAPQTKKLVNMARIADLLCQSANSERFDGAWYVKFAFEMGADIPRARELFAEYGCGWIYPANGNGLVMQDTPRNRRKMVTMYGYCVVINERGSMWKRTPKDIGTLNRKKARIGDCVARHKIERNEREYRETKRQERFFESVQTKACPKHQGRANGLHDIGQYVNAPYWRRSVRENEPVHRKVYAIVSL